MNDFQKILFDSLLGDGCIYQPHECRNYRFQLTQMYEHLDSIESRYTLLEPFVRVNIYHKKGIHKEYKEKTHYTKPSYLLETGVHTDITHLHQKMYISGFKGVPVELANYIDWRTVAHWYMDDGSLDLQRNGRKYSASFSTDGFIKSDCEVLQEAVQDLLGVYLHMHKAKVNKAGQQTYRMRTSASTFGLFMEGIQEFVVPSFYYKLAVREAPGKYTRMKIRSDLTSNGKSDTEMVSPACTHASNK